MARIKMPTLQNKLRPKPAELCDVVEKSIPISVKLCIATYAESPRLGECEAIQGRMAFKHGN